jgi:hypothetical protein
MKEETRPKSATVWDIPDLVTAELVAETYGSSLASAWKLLLAMERDGAVTVQRSSDGRPLFATWKRPAAEQSEDDPKRRKRATRQRSKAHTVPESTLTHSRRLRRRFFETLPDHRLREPWVPIAMAEEIALALERGHYAGAHGRDRLPEPPVLRGESSIWDGSERDPNPETCPSCGGRDLQPHEYCLRCDNWGLQHLIPVALRPKKARRRRKRKAEP